MFRLQMAPLDVGSMTCTGRSLNKFGHFRVSPDATIHKEEIGRAHGAKP